MKTGYSFLFSFVLFCSFAVTGIVLGSLFKGEKEPGKLHTHMHWNHS